MNSNIKFEYVGPDHCVSRLVENDPNNPFLYSACVEAYKSWFSEVPAAYSVCATHDNVVVGTLRFQEMVVGNRICAASLGTWVHPSFRRQHVGLRMWQLFFEVESGAYAAGHVVQIAVISEEGKLFFQALLELSQNYKNVVLKAS